MMNARELRYRFDLLDYGTAITREDFEANFRHTDEVVAFTFNGWDGKSYNGESRKARVYRARVKGYEDIKFVKVGKGVHYIDEDRMVTEKATGEMHPEAGWLVDIKIVRAR